MLPHVVPEKQGLSNDYHPLLPRLEKLNTGLNYFKRYAHLFPNHSPVT